MSNLSFELPPFADDISHLSFSPSSALLVGSWDATAQLFEVTNSTSTLKHIYRLPAACLCTAFPSDDGFCGSIDGSVNHLNANTGLVQEVAKVSSAISAIKVNHLLYNLLTDCTRIYCVFFFVFFFFSGAVL